MKLLYGKVSPFVRKVTVTLHELGLHDQVERVPSLVSATQPNPEVIQHNPIGKIPTLVLGDGSALYDSTVICEYLARSVGDKRLFPETEARWHALRLNALSDGLLVAGVLARNEVARAPELQWQAIYTAQWTKVENCLHRLEELAPTLTLEPTIGEIASACAIGWLDFRVTDFDWKAGHARLADWYARIIQRPSFQSTMPSA